MWSKANKATYTLNLLIRLYMVDYGTIYMPQGGFKPGSSAHQMCLNIVDDLNRSATTSGNNCC